MKKPIKYYVKSKEINTYDDLEEVIDECLKNRNRIYLNGKVITQINLENELYLSVSMDELRNISIDYLTFDKDLEELSIISCDYSRKMADKGK